jgi:hypothetical protein
MALDSSGEAMTPAVHSCSTFLTLVLGVRAVRMLDSRMSRNWTADVSANEAASRCSLDGKYL